LHFSFPENGYISVANRGRRRGGGVKERIKGKEGKKGSESIFHAILNTYRTKPTEHRSVHSLFVECTMHQNTDLIDISISELLPSFLRLKYEI
jgi:hypothetical protein